MRSSFFPKKMTAFCGAVMKIQCAVCDSDRVKKIRRKFEARYNQMPIAVENVEMYRCDACGEEFFTPEQSRELSWQMKNRVNEERRT
jgi:YgiT-type zinc finger domain-containing protein